MSFGNIIGSVLRRGVASSAGKRLRAGADSAGRAGAEQTLKSLLARGRSGSGFAEVAESFLGKSGESGAKTAGLGALAAALLKGGIGGAARGGAIAVLATLALSAWRQHEKERSGKDLPPEATPDEANALTGPETERLLLCAMIGAAQADGRVDDEEMERILGRVGGAEATNEERREARELAAKPVDPEALGARVRRPEVATEVYLAALLAVDGQSPAETDYLRRLASALRLDPSLVQRLHRMTDAQEP